MEEAGKKYSEMSILNSDDLKKLFEKYLAQKDSASSGDGEMNPQVRNLDGGPEKMEAYLRMVNTLDQIQASVASTSTTADSRKCEIYQNVNAIREVVSELMETTKEDMAKPSGPIGEYFTRMGDKLIKMVEDVCENDSDNEEGQETETETEQEAEPPKVENKKSKCMIIKMKSAHIFLEQIKAFTKNIPLNVLKVLDDDKILISYKKEEDGKIFKPKLERIFPGVIIYEEPDENVEIVIDNVGNITDKDLAIEIKKITHETPNIISIVETEKEKKWRAQVGLSSLAMLKLQAQNENTITIGNLESEYHVLCE